MAATQCGDTAWKCGVRSGVTMKLNSYFVRIAAVGLQTYPVIMYIAMT